MKDFFKRECKASPDNKELRFLVSNYIFQVEIWASLRMDNAPEDMLLFLVIIFNLFLFVFALFSVSPSQNGQEASESILQEGIIFQHLNANYATNLVYY